MKSIVEITAHKYRENIEKYENKHKIINEIRNKLAKENHLLKSKIGNFIQKKEILNLLLKVQNKKLSVTFKSSVDYTVSFEIRK
jgi:hypothetical protein